MKKFNRIKGLTMPLDRSNVDTDAIIPKQYLKSIQRTGFGEVLFDAWRYLTPGEPGDDHSQRALNKQFVLNQPRYHNAEILLARENFGCGSSREHAPWALQQYGFKVIIAPSFADIFYNNAFKNGLLLITLDKKLVDKLFNETLMTEGYALEVDLQTNTICTPSAPSAPSAAPSAPGEPAGEVIEFVIEEYRRHRLLNGLDDIALTLQYADDIKAFEIKHRQRAPWLFQ